MSNGNQRILEVRRIGLHEKNPYNPYKMTKKCNTSTQSHDVAIRTQYSSMTACHDIISSPQNLNFDYWVKVESGLAQILFRNMMRQLKCMKWIKIQIIVFRESPGLKT